MSTVAGGKARHYRSAETLGRWLRWLLVLSAIHGAVLGVLELKSAANLRQLGGVAPLPLDLIPGIAPAWFVLLSQLGLATTVIWLVWQHRSQANLYAASLPALKYTPGWAVGWWFVPVANFFMPYRTMQELWKRSGASSKRPLVGPWWVVFIGTSAISLCAALVRLASGTGDGGVLTFSLGAVANERIVSGIAGCVHVLSALFAIQIVSGIDRAQAVIRDLALSGSMPAVPNQSPPRPDLGSGPG